jgi:hypothetical protein
VNEEDTKLVTLARSALSRSRAGHAAALRDDMGRTYVAAGVELPSLQLSALQAAIVTAVGSGVRRLEGAALVARDGDVTDLDPVDRAVLADLGGCPVLLVDAAGGARVVVAS